MKAERFHVVLIQNHKEIIMENNIRVTGIKTALVSCVDDNGKVYENDMRKLMEWNCAAGMNGFYINGGTGQGPAYLKEVRMEIAEIAVDEAKKLGDCQIINHVGAIDLKTAAELAEHAAKIGCDAISSVPPFFFGYGEKEICQYYKTLADASGLPVLMYASPLSGVEITPKMVEHFMQEIPNLIGLKWTNPNYYTMSHIKQLNGGNINVINGPDETLLLGLIMGADGGIGGTYNCMPVLFRKIYDYYKAGELEKAREVQFKANKMIDLLLSLGGGCIATVKEALRYIGYETGYTVYPGKRLTDDEKEKFIAGLKAIHYEEEYLGTL